MQINSLETTLRRINQIERRFEQLSAKELADDFQAKLKEASMNQLQPSAVNNSTNNVPNLKISSVPTMKTDELPDLYKDIISKNAREKGIDENLLKAVIKTESNFNPNAKSPVGALGLMQLMPSTAQSLGILDPYDPKQNIDGGSTHLKGLLDKYKGNKELALAAYNAGEGAVEKYAGIPPYRETQNYIQKVLQTEKILSEQNIIGDEL